MAVSPNTPLLPKFQQPISRRAVMSTGIAATALAAVPVLAAVPEPVDPHALVKQRASELANALQAARGGTWDVFQCREFNFVVVIDQSRVPAFAEAGAPKRRRKAVRS